MKAVSLALALAVPTHAYLRFGCASLVLQRLDPVVQPGVIPSSHIHQIVGGNAFNATMQGDIGEKATCTTCHFAEDFSNYWTAILYFKSRNGSFHRVPQYPNAYLGSLTGGLTAYYIQQDFSSNGNQKITSFKPGFRMTVGTPGNKSPNNPGLHYTCLQTVMTRFPETSEFPKKPCPAGIMADIHFPACWNGKDLDSPNHQDHMYNSGKGGFVAAGACPASHPIRMPQVAFEVLWNTTMFNDQKLWPEDGSQPFVWSHDDETGYGLHGDYLFGWKGDALQRAMDASGLTSDSALKTQGVDAANRCSIKSSVNEPVDGWLQNLPGQHNM